MQILTEALGVFAYLDAEMTSEASSPPKHHVNTPEWPSETKKRRLTGKNSEPK